MKLLLAITTLSFICLGCENKPANTSQDQPIPSAEKSALDGNFIDL